MLTENSIPEIIGVAKVKEERNINVSVIDDKGKYYIFCKEAGVDRKEESIDVLDLSTFPLNIVKDEVSLILDFEELRFGPIDNRKIHVDFEASFVKEGRTQRGNEWHLDHLGNGKFARQYMFSSVFPTEFLLEQHPAIEYKTRFKGNNIWSPKDNEIVLSNTRYIHRSPRVKHDCHRFFFRMTVVI